MHTLADKGNRNPNSLLPNEGCHEELECVSYHAKELPRTLTTREVAASGILFEKPAFHD